MARKENIFFLECKKHGARFTSAADASQGVGPVDFSTATQSICSPLPCKGLRAALCRLGDGLAQLRSQRVLEMGRCELRMLLVAVLKSWAGKLFPAEEVPGGRNAVSGAAARPASQQTPGRE